MLVKCSSVCSNSGTNIAGCTHRLYKTRYRRDNLRPKQSHHHLLPTPPSAKAREPCPSDRTTPQFTLSIFRGSLFQVLGLCLNPLPPLEAPGSQKDPALMGSISLLRLQCQTTSPSPFSICLHGIQVPQMSRKVPLCVFPTLGCTSTV